MIGSLNLNCKASLDLAYPHLLYIKPVHCILTKFKKFDSFQSIIYLVNSTFDMSIQPGEEGTVPHN